LHLRAGTLIEDDADSEAEDVTKVKQLHSAPKARKRARSVSVNVKTEDSVAGLKKVKKEVKARKPKKRVPEAVKEEIVYKPIGGELGVSDTNEGIDSSDELETIEDCLQVASGPFMGTRSQAKGCDSKVEELEFE
ncbi:hypothetical protein CPLU01_16116, partial [Colletotrichum plurivorum]